MWDPERWSLAEALSPHSRGAKTISEAFDDGGEDNDESGENEEDQGTQFDTDWSATSVSLIGTVMIEILMRLADNLMIPLIAVIGWLKRSLMHCIDDSE
jgi:hypothetical protein